MVRAVATVTSEEYITAVQFTRSECRITFNNLEAKQKVKAQGLDIGGTYVKLVDADRTIISITIKDAPVEMDDSVLTTKLAQYGKVMEGSMKRGKIRGTNIENGLRYVNLTNLEETTMIPASCQIGRFEIRLVCDQNRDTLPKPAVRRCYRCRHMRYECESEVVCKYCGQSGHMQRDCDDHKELELGQPLEDQVQQQLHVEREAHDELNAKTDDGEDDSEEAASVASLDAEPEKDCKAVILGASLVKHMDLKDKAVLVAKPGTCASEVESLLDIAEAKIEAENVERVLIHLGTNDLSQAHGDVDSVKLNLVEAMGKVKAFFPRAVIGVAAIPPRKGKGASVHKYNNDAKSVNHYLGALAERDSNIEFLDTYKIFAPGGEHVVKRLYSERDGSGVHFSAEGIDTLQREFEKFLNTESDGRNKRLRSDTQTPSSVEKMSKNRRENNSS